MTEVIIIPLERYNELLRKEVIYDIERAKRVSDVAKGSYVADSEKILYQVTE